jgi:hypothetical protein
MNTKSALDMIAGIASGRLIRRMMPSLVQPSMAAASSRLTGIVSK